MWTIASGTAAGIQVDFVTSDQHIGHENIIRFCDRPYNSVNHMNVSLMNEWNKMVTPDDTVLILGDIAMGSLEDSLNLWKQFNGTRILVPGNHDRMSEAYSPARRERFLPMYEEAGFITIEESVLLEDENGRKVLASHYPYKGDSQEKDRHVELRPQNDGLPLLHGHTHSPLVYETDTSQFHVGVDAHEYKPIPMARISKWLNTICR